MLAFDIETTGLKPLVNTITCACVYDGERGIERSFLFARDADPEEFMRLLDGADRLCAFNGVRFDVPFIARRWNVSPARYGRWIAKLFDPFETCKAALDATFSLNKLLALNGLPIKTSSGLEAIAMAYEGRLDELADYCMHDTKMTHAVCVLERMRLPLDARTHTSAVHTAQSEYASLNEGIVDVSAGVVCLRTQPAGFEVVYDIY